MRGLALFCLRISVWGLRLIKGLRRLLYYIESIDYRGILSAYMMRIRDQALTFKEGYVVRVSGKSV